MAKPFVEIKIDILVKEWDHVQSHIMRFDTICFSIRGWAISIFTAMLAVSLTKSLPSLMIVAALPIGMFWMVDALFKSFQMRVIVRGEQIENYLASSVFKNDVDNGDIKAIQVPGLSKTYRAEPRRHLVSMKIYRLKDVLRAACLWNVMLPYISMFALCTLSYFFISNSR